MVLAWIRLPGLPSFMYKWRILEAIGGLVGNVVKLDLNTDSKTRCRFARMDVFVDLNKAIVSQVMVNGELQSVEYEALLTICFSCGKYGQIRKGGPQEISKGLFTDGSTQSKGQTSNGD
ncbi:hypothetical protein Goshw_022329 [Gossypium schwendimanii]|uniref:DUF4283 domain-containing protein n=1 Tax=Gossypium schwendimanii TaxID=34291 RepID=A0A7J9L5Y9_GOSSC|nr:hypothetical protein [Gossypium schwendimanii]